MASKGLHFSFFLPGTNKSPNFKKSNFAISSIKTTSRDLNKVTIRRDQKKAKEIEPVIDASPSDYKSEINSASLETPRTLIPRLQQKIEKQPCKFLKEKNGSSGSIEKKVSSCHLAPIASYLSPEYSPSGLQGDTEEL